MRRRRGYLLLALMVSCLPVLAQQFWAKKDWHQWSGEECAKLLEDSPWARNRIVGDEALSTPGAGLGANITFVAQLWSATPLRQAAVRRAQLNANHTRLSEGERKVFQEDVDRLLTTDFADRIVVKVIYLSRIPRYRQDLFYYYRHRTVGDWKQNTFLVTSKGRVALSEVQVATDSDQFELTFTRLVDGRPVITPTDKSFGVEFVYRTVGAVGFPREERVLINFKVADLMLNGQLHF